MFTGPIGAKRRGKDDVGDSWPERLISGRDLLKRIQFATKLAQLKASVSNEINANSQPAEDVSGTPKQPEEATQGLAVEKTDLAATIVAAEAAPNSETR